MIGSCHGLFLLHPQIKDDEFCRLREAIASFWNGYQLSTEPHTLIVNYNKEKCIDLLTRFLCENELSTIKHNLKIHEKYKDLIALSNKYEKELKKNE